MHTAIKIIIETGKHQLLGGAIQAVVHIPKRRHFVATLLNRRKRFSAQSVVSNIQAFFSLPVTCRLKVLRNVDASASARKSSQHSEQLQELSALLNYLQLRI